MKKLFLMLLVIITVEGCKKETLSPTCTPQNKTMEEQVADLIQRTDKDLYDRCYNSLYQKQPIVTVKSIPGAFVILNGDVASGTCFPTNGVCMTIISVAKFQQTTPTGTEVSVITNNTSETYPENFTTRLILNSSPQPTLKVIKSFNAHFGNNGVVTFSYKQ
jgi:hypothetical protein